MKTLAKCIIIFLVLFSEVRVRAKVNHEIVNMQSSVEEPPGCLRQKSSCAIYARQKNVILELPEGVVHLAKGASAKMDKFGGVHLVRGLFYVSASGDMKISNLYSEFQVSKGESLIEASDSKIEYTVLSGEFDYKPKGESKYHKLPEGYSTFSSYITSSGVALTGFPRPAEVEKVTRLWASFIKKTEAKEFKIKLSEFLANWRKVTESVGGWYVDIVRREIASLRSEEARQAAIRAEQEKENIKLRNMFRDRIFKMD